VQANAGFSALSEAAETKIPRPFLVMFDTLTAETAGTCRYLSFVLNP
jgi:hypothetical protein